MSRALSLCPLLLLVFATTATQLRNDAPTAGPVYANTTTCVLGRYITINVTFVPASIPAGLRLVAGANAAITDNFAILNADGKWRTATPRILDKEILQYQVDTYPVERAYVKSTRYNSRGFLRLESALDGAAAESWVRDVDPSPGNNQMLCGK